MLLSWQKTKCIIRDRSILMVGFPLRDTGPSVSFIRDTPDQCDILLRKVDTADNPTDILCRWCLESSFNVVGA